MIKRCEHPRLNSGQYLKWIKCMVCGKIWKWAGRGPTTWTALREGKEIR